MLYISGTNEGSIARLRLLEPGMEFLEKPFSLDRLLRTVRQALGDPDEGAGRREPRLRPADPADETADAYRALFERNPLPMWIYDSETLAFLEVNDAAVREYGYIAPRIPRA